ncbi:hypothetical protein UFOVP1087_14 [uncultured Caudovirales phage]|uniref:Uncharacterized protein n=1 Tax=uncultured Caudovirales phage TaxID=2100421 RepID=A0A6J7XDN8_9CAUD|nr:hypothetical protein UFOVP910_29 [uncultured Caudovirales phage]CAB4182612.1 hypothetical protein UFOVP1087_14 [uncultured Caudovirales phage]CAB5228241.1 hypothetical protein UFOVP1534_32 [uncultured Caudovirales phage]
MLTISQLATVTAHYRNQTNTYGHTATVLERRPSGDKSEAAWEPVYDSGNDPFDRVTFTHEEGYYKGNTFGVNLTCWLDPRPAVDAMLYLKMYAYKDTYTMRLKRYALPQAQADTVEANNTWKAREAQRFVDGTYTPLPWSGEAWATGNHRTAHHYAHVSVEDAGKIAFTRDERGGQMNIKTRMSAGRYLREYFYDELSNQPHRETGGVNVHGNKITVDALNYYARTFSSTYGGGDKLAFATTPEDMVRVYIDGPTSCMSYTNDDYKCAPHHPAEVYGNSDLHLAYLTDGDNRITARALVWPAKMYTGRIYGDEVSLQAMLSEAGYGRQDNYGLQGARIRRIPFEDGHVMPYVDGSLTYGRCKDDPTNYFVIGGDHSAERTDGLDYDSDEAACTCDHCGDGMQEDEAHSAQVTRYESATYCETCYEEHTFTCDWSHDQWSLDANHTVLANGELVAYRYISHYAQCTITHDWYRDGELMPYGTDGDMVSQDGIDQDELVADEDGNYWQADELPTPQDDIGQTDTAAVAA